MGQKYITTFSGHNIHIFNKKIIKCVKAWFTLKNIYTYYNREAGFTKANLQDVYSLSFFCLVWIDNF